MVIFHSYVSLPEGTHHMIHSSRVSCKTKKVFIPVLGHLLQKYLRIAIPMTIPKKQSHYIRHHRISQDTPVYHYYPTQAHLYSLPSGKRLHNYGKSPFLMGKAIINGPFSIAFCMFTRGYIILPVRFISACENRGTATELADQGHALVVLRTYRYQRMKPWLW